MLTRWTGVWPAIPSTSLAALLATRLVCARECELGLFVSAFRRCRGHQGYDFEGRIICLGLKLGQ